MNGLLVNIFESKSSGNCSNGGISANAKNVILIDCDCDIFSTNENTPAVKIVKRKLMHDNEYLTAYPVDDKGNPITSGMFGGSFIYSSDSRFPARYPVPLHDRFETSFDNWD